MFGRKHMKRTCRACKNTWLVPYKIRLVTMPKQPGTAARWLKPGYRLEEIARQTDLALLFCICKSCGSGNYSQKQVRA